MEVGSDITLADRERLFADWGEPVTLREVTQTYDPEAGSVEETYVDMEVTAVARGPVIETVRGTGGQHAAGDVTFLLRAEDAGDQAALRGRRIVHLGTEYGVVSVSAAQSNGIMAALCRAV